MGFQPDWLGGGFSATFTNLTVNGDFNFGSASVQSLFIGDEDTLLFGNTAAAPNVRILWETADANANELIIAMPEGGAINVPVMVLGDSTLLNKDLGLFNGVTSPTIAVVDGAATKALALSHNGTNAIINVTSGALNVTTGNLSVVNGSLLYSSNGLYSAANSSYMGFGGFAATDTFLAYDKTTAQFGAFLGSASGRQFIIGEATYNVNGGAYDYDHAVQSTPTLYLQSLNSPNVDNRQWVKWYNDGSNSYHLTGIGGHLFGFEAIQANAILEIPATWVAPIANNLIIFTVNTGTLTGKTAGAGAGEFNYGATAAATATNIATAYNLIAGTGVVAHASGNTVVFEASATGIAANSYTVTETTDTNNLYRFQGQMVWTANPTTIPAPLTTPLITVTVGTGTLSGVWSTPGANQFQIGGTLSETVNNFVRAYNALATGVNAIANENPATGFMEVFFDGGTTGVDIFTETVDTDAIFSFTATTPGVPTVMSGGRIFSSFMAMQPGYLKLTKTGIATAGPVNYNSQYLGLTGSAWDSDDLVPRDVEVRFQTVANSSTSGTGTLNVSHWRNGAVTATMFTVNSGGTAGFSGNVNSTLAQFGTTSSLPVTIKGNDADDATGVGTILDATIALTTAGSKLVSVRNAGVEKAYIDKDGITVVETNKRVACGGGSTGATTTSNGTITLEINGVSYYLLKAATA